MAFTIARPSTLLDLPGLVLHTETFRLGEDGEMVAHWTKKFIEQVRSSDFDFAELVVDDEKSFALVCGQRAQQWAAHPLLAKTPTTGEDDEQERSETAAQRFYQPPRNRTWRKQRFLEILGDKGNAAGVLPTEPTGETKDLDYDPDKDVPDVEEESPNAICADKDVHSADG
ncbi:MAG: hypothetical protein Q9221_008931, partial [Calogaya cf. arnoldii]